MADTLAELLGIDFKDAPYCAEITWKDGVGATNFEDTRVAAKIFLILCKMCAICRDSAVKMVTEQILSGERFAELDPELILSDAMRVYSSDSSESICKIAKDCKIRECCDYDNCNWPKYSKNLKIKPTVAIDDILKPVDETVRKAAEDIMNRGNVLKFLVQQAQRNHIGDTDVIKHLLASIASTNSLTSAGIQPELNGEKGHGKTDAVKAVFHLVPDHWKLAASISAKALYYFKNIPAGAIIFSDDIQWSDDLISTVKRSMGNFQQRQVHYTLDKNRNPLPQEMPERLVWWLSSVESVVDDQLKDRQYSLDIDESSSHSAQVSDYLRRSRAQKVVRFSVDWRIEITRYIIDKIKSHEPFKVVIPCAEFANWKVKEDHRTLNKFWDLVEAFAILRFRQRHIDPDGWLHATLEDFNEAKTIFMRRKANHRTHLTNAQTRIVKSVISLQNEPDGATQATIAQDLGISTVAVCKSLKAIEANTRFIVDYPGAHGERFYKATVCALEVAYEEGDIVILPEGYIDQINQNKPSINHELTNQLTTKTNNSSNKYTYNKPNKEEHSNPELENSQIESEHCYTPENGLSRLIQQQQGHQEVNKIVNQMVNSASGSQVNKVNPESKPKYLIPVKVIRFLKDQPKKIVAEDIRHPKSTKEYGPFEFDSIATLPELNARIFIDKGYAEEVA